jgi:Cation transporter/ATPase, N-terminus
MTHAPGHIVRPRMPGSSVGLPKGVVAALRRQPPPIRVAPILLESASLTSDVVYQRLRSRATGLTTDEAEARLSEHGPNMVAADGRKSIGLLVRHAAINPLVLLLAVLAAISFSTGDTRPGIVMSLMIVLGVGLRLIQERKADTVAAALGVCQRSDQGQFALRRRPEAGQWRTGGPSSPIQMQRTIRRTSPITPRSTRFRSTLSDGSCR